MIGEKFIGTGHFKNVYPLQTGMLWCRDRQEKDILKMARINVFVLLSLFIFAGIVHAKDDYVYQQQDAAAEKRQYVVKIEQDLRKCDLAIENTKVLINRSKNRPYLPTLLLRLAELYIEKSRLIYFIRRGENIEEKSDESGLDQFESNALKQEAIEIYQQILSHHPDFEGCDKVHFFLAHEYRELGELDKMLAQYKEIIMGYKESDYVPESHLLLGDYYFNQTQELEPAIAEYKEVLNYPGSPAAAIARYKLAWCRINKEDYTGAIELFETAVAHGARPDSVDIDTYQRVDVRFESLVDMAFCYPEVHKKATTEEALLYFKGFAWSRPVYAMVLEKLASRYFVKKRWANAAGIYRKLADLRQDSEKLLEYTHRIFECVQALGNYDTAEEDVALIIKALEKQKYSVHVDDAEKEKNIANFELFARETITHQHDKARNTGSTADFAKAADAYKRYLDFFDDSPAMEDMAANYAEALFSSQRYLAAGKQYEKMAPEITVNRKQRKESLYSAVISYYNALKNKDALNFYESAYARAGLRSAGKLFVAENPDSTRTADVQFNVAWVAYDAGHYKDAIEEFDSFIKTYPGHSATTAAVQLTLDAYHLLEDKEGLIRYGKSILANNRVVNTDLKTEISQIVRGTESKMVSAMTMTAMNDWESGKEALTRMSNESGSEKSEQALNALILTAREKKDLPALFDAGLRLLASYPDATQVENTLGILIDTSMKIGQFRLLGSYMQQFAERYPKNENALDFILQAARIHEALGRYAAANSTYRRRLIMGGMNTALLDDVVFAMAENAQRLNNPSEALNILDGYLTRLSATAKLRAYAKMAVLYLASGQRSMSRKYSRMAKKGFEKKSHYEDLLLRDAMGQMVYEEVYGSSGPYFALQFKGDIDNKIFSQKSDMLKKLEDGYQQVIAYKSSAWALKACFRAARINGEFARFLKKSPVPPELSGTEKQEYRTLLSQRADGYTRKAAAYLDTCAELARKSEICDPALAGYFLPEGAPQGSETAFSSLASVVTCSEIGSQGFSNQALTALYQQLLQNPDDTDLQIKLTQAYLKEGDYRQALLIAQNALSKIGDKERNTRARLLNFIGVARLYGGEDRLARDAFKQALAADKRLRAAGVNLAGLLYHYGHREKAAALRGQTGTGGASAAEVGSIHPRAGAIFNEYAMRTP